MAAVKALPTAVCTAAMMISKLGGPGAGGGGVGSLWGLWVGVVVKSMVAVGTLWLAVIRSTHIPEGVLVEVLALLGEEDLSRVGACLSRAAADLSRAKLDLSCDRAADLLRVIIGALPRVLALLAPGVGDGTTATAVLVGAGDLRVAEAGVLTKLMLVSLLALAVLVVRARLTVVLASRWKYVGHPASGSGSTASVLTLM